MSNTKVTATFHPYDEPTPLGARLGLLAFRPLEIWWGWKIRRAYRNGKFRRPQWSADQGKPCVTTRRR